MDTPGGGGHGRPLSANHQRYYYDNFSIYFLFGGLFVFFLNPENSTRTLTMCLTAPPLFLQHIFAVI